MKPFSEVPPHVRFYHSDAADVLSKLPERSVQCVVTSPPYWGLRDYGLEPSVWGGDAGCEHTWRGESYQRRSNDDGKTQKQLSNTGANRRDEPIHHAFCSCGAWLGTLGLEPTPDLYMEHLVELFREVRRVLRDDGTVWLNLGDSYANSGTGGNGATGGRDKSTLQSQMPPIDTTPVDRTVPPGLKPKDLVGIPWRVAFALQADGWWLRSDIIWAKPNPMPESVTDRPTRSHEYVFLLTKSARYYYDAEVVKEPQSAGTFERYGPGERIPSWNKAGGSDRKNKSFSDATPDAILPNGRNKRSVWTIATQPFKEAHFATFPEKLVEPCIKAGTSEKGCCPECGAPWVRVVEKSRTFESGSGRSGNMPTGKNGANLQGGGETRDVRRGPVLQTHTTGWRPTCPHTSDPVPCTVLDPFCGSGTVAYVAQRLGISSIGIDLSEDYLEMATLRCLGIYDKKRKSPPKKA